MKVQVESKKFVSCASVIIQTESIKRVEWNEVSGAKQQKYLRQRNFGPHRDFL